ncbi:MAG: hypothetical protein GY795_45525 [Desulfobacterales bacterium]|nr:hypothetical protein [Desulfobacterales bacterium]
MKVDENVWNTIQKHLGYTDEEMKIFRSDPKNEDILSKTPALMNKTIVAEVVESHGCNSQHKKGDKFYLDGAGSIISKLSPKRMCIFPMASLAPLVFGIHELFYAGIDPNEMRFKRAGCLDVGVHCGGWGHIVMEVRVEDRKK